MLSETQFSGTRSTTYRRTWSRGRGACSGDVPREEVTPLSVEIPFEVLPRRVPQRLRRQPPCAADTPDIAALTVTERQLRTRALRHTGGNQPHAAQILGITRNSLRHKLRALGITIARAVCAADDQSASEMTSPLQ
jgi:DNA-binding NtrC family response regulator